MMDSLCDFDIAEEGFESPATWSDEVADSEYEDDRHSNACESDFGYATNGAVEGLVEWEEEEVADPSYTWAYKKEE